MIRPFRLFALAALAALATSTPAHADGIDCRAARAPIDRSICADPDLLAQDRALAAAFAAGVVRDPGHAADLRRDEIAWLKARNVECGQRVDDAARARCLAGYYAKRLAELAPPPSAPASAPVAAAPSPASAPEPPPAAPEPPAALPQAAASLDATTLPVTPRMETLLHVTTPGRFSLTAKSATGTALQLVDMLTGPSDLAGAAGGADGRLDVLLDQGTYKLRAFAADDATGTVTLAAAPFRDAAPSRTLDVQTPVTTSLGDLQQRGFWFDVRPSTPIRLEAAGRALADLRLWRNGTDLAPLVPEVRVIEPTRGHPLADMVLRGMPEPGAYLLIAYGGQDLAWADGAAGQPLYLRAVSSQALDTAAVTGTIGPFGSEMFAVPSFVGSLRLDLPQPADVHLAVVGAAPAETAIARKSREPTARLDIPVADDPTRFIDVSGTEGQPFTLRAAPRRLGLTLSDPGTFWVAAASAGLGGDEPPATLVFARTTADRKTTIVSANAPRIGPGLAWRQRFNLRGPISILFQVAAAGPVAPHVAGVATEASIVPLGADTPLRADGAKPTQWDLAPGWYELRLAPAKGAGGVLDLTLGPPGVQPPDHVATQPDDPVLPLGLMTLAPRERLMLFAGSAVGADTGLLARPAPVDLAAEPLVVTQAGGAALEVPVRLPPDGQLVAAEIGGAPVAVAFVPVPGPAPGRIGMAGLPAPDHARTLTLAWRPPSRPQPPIAPPAPPQALPRLAAGVPSFLDLGRDQQRSFAVEVPAGGLFRVETLGRLHTAGAIGTPFIPELNTADANGIGENFLIQRFLRASSYRLRVSAKDSAGRLGLVVRPSSVAAGATLVAGGSVRAVLGPDSGVVFPIEIAAAGTYHLDLLSLAHGLTARLEDVEGWPLLPAGDLTALDQDLRPGRYRLLVQPVGIAARVVARLARVLPDAERTGHGPFPLVFGETASATWREPAGRDDPRPPDVWKFSLAGQAAVTLAVSDGMVADLLADGTVVPLARFTSAEKFSGTLPAGDYVVHATSLGRNDRLDYALALASRELQPGRPRRVTLPATLPFAVAADRVVSLTTFGRIPLRAVLKRADGSVVERVGDRGSDWNIGLSRLLPAGAYTLTLATAAPGAEQPVTPSDAQTPVDTNTDQGDNQGTMSGQDQPVQDQGGQDQGAQDQTGHDQQADDSEAAKPANTVEISLALPEDGAMVPATADDVADLAGGGVHHLLLPQAPPGALTVAAAASSADLVLALERRDAAGVWQTTTIARGTAPVVGALADGEWRASVWTLDGGGEPIHFAARVATLPAVPPGAVTPMPLDLGGLPQRVAVAHLVVPGAGPVHLAGATDLSAVSAEGEALAPLDGPLVLPQSEQVWLLARRPDGPLALTPVAAAPGGSLALTIPEAGHALLPGALPAAGRTRLWLAQSGLGQPGAAAGRGMGVADGSALALDSDGRPARLFNAGGTGPLRLWATALDLVDQPPRELDAAFSEKLPPYSALPLRLPEGVHRVALDLAAGTAAITDWHNPAAVTVWTGTMPVSRVVEGDITDLLLVNTGALTAPVAVTWSTGDAVALAVRPEAPVKRFFGAAGSLDLPVAGPGRLVVAGGTATLLGADGTVARGRTLALAGPGRVVLDHGPGLLAAWIEGGTTPPWPEPAPQTIALPAHLALHDAAMTLALSPATPVLLHIASTAPLILALGDEPPTPYPTGAELHRYLPIGPTTLRIVSPHDGPLAGTLDLSTAPVAEAGEGLGPTVPVAPGGTVAFGFHVARVGLVGLGVRADPDRAEVRLRDAAGRLLGEGMAQLHRLKPGRYVLEVTVPPDSAPTLVRPALIGLAPRPNGPPQDIINSYLELAGRAPIPVAAKGTAP